MSEQERILNGLNGLPLFVRATSTGTGKTCSVSNSRREQLQELSERAVARENEEYLNKIDKRLIEAAEKGLWSCKYKVPRKLIDNNEFMEVLQHDIDVEVKIDETFQNPMDYLLVFDWRKK